ncbi:MAG: ribonuclease HII [Candidatus Syntropharchaeia archaeon]
MRTAGIDEAGKGPVIGPMFVVGVVAEEKDLVRIGVRDSKKLSKKRREMLWKIIENFSEFYVLEVSAERIDELRKIMTMNDIVLHSFSEVLRKLHPEKVFVDSADVDPLRFAFHLSKSYGKKIGIISEHRADTKYPLVSAASIGAKVYRDRAISRIEREVGERIGSGYPSDPVTIEFLKKMVKRGKILPYIRFSWKTVKRL